MNLKPNLLPAMALFLAVSTCLSCGGGHEGREKESGAAPAGDECDDLVWRAVLAYAHEKSTDLKSEIVILNTTDDPWTKANAKDSAFPPIVLKDMKQLEESTWRNYRSRVSMAASLKPDRFDTTLLYRPVVILSPEERDRISGWKEFSGRHPGSVGVFTLSQPGYNAGRTQALVHFSLSQFEAGHGEMILLEWREGAWRLVAEKPTWISCVF